MLRAHETSIWVTHQGAKKGEVPVGAVLEHNKEDPRSQPWVSAEWRQLVIPRLTRRCFAFAALLLNWAAGD
ncbi:hypothetical protein KC19_7G135600 [Ceratodon purpureus]|uniref:Uncharacterized protein n=1 Tax=Ceratodon purpureus TaxID=3225 RepID=A0A8T0HEI9_CERPU|nr:hypothetical protein KC19_7G135600 [Ceratodon purpureus]